MASADLTAETTKPRDAPKPIKWSSMVVDLTFHPQKDVIALGDQDGDITLHSYSQSEGNNELFKLTHHKKSCRCIQFSTDGSRLYSGSADKSFSVIDMEKGAVYQHHKKAHGDAIYSMCVVDPNIVVTGDDDGMMKVWDLRQGKAVMEVKENEDFISDMIMDNAKKCFLTASGDGSLTCFDIRKQKTIMQSQNYNSDMLSLCFAKEQQKLICGMGEGALNIFNYGEWYHYSDSWPGHPLSVDSIVPYNDDYLFTGSSDGIIRAVSIQPNRFLGIIGEHKDYPVENMSLSHCRRFLASCSHDQKVCFWNVEDVAQEKVDTHRKKAPKTNKPKIINKAKAREDFFAGFAEEEVQQDGGGADSDSSDDSDTDSDSDTPTKNKTTKSKEITQDSNKDSSDDSELEDPEMGGIDIDSSDNDSESEISDVESQQAKNQKDDT